MSFEASRGQHHRRRGTEQALPDNQTAFQNRKIASLTRFVLRVLSYVTFGFAAGCAAEALPRRRDTVRNLGYARGVASGRVSPQGKARTRGIARRQSS